MRDGIESGVLFWYRASDAQLVPGNFSGASLANGRVSLSDPPPMRAGDRRVWLDTKGRLTRYEAVPPQLDSDAGPSTPGIDWDRLFVAAGLDPARFTSVAPQSGTSRRVRSRVPRGQAATPGGRTRPFGSRRQPGAAGRSFSA